MSLESGVRIDRAFAALERSARASTSLPRPQTLLALIRAVTLATFAVAETTLPSKILGAAALYVVGACVLGNLRPKWRGTDVAMLVAIVCADIAWCTAAFVYFGPLHSLPAVLYAALVSAIVAAASGWTAIMVGLATASVYACTMLLTHREAPLPPFAVHLAIFHALVMGLSGTLSGCLADQWRRLCRTRETVEQLRRLNQVSGLAVVSASDDRAVLQAAVHAALRIFDAERAWVMLRADDADESMELVAWAGFEPPDRQQCLSRERGGVARRVLDTYAGVIVTPLNHANTELSALESALTRGQLMAAPINGDDGPASVLLVTRDAEAAPFEEEDLAVLTLLGRTTSNHLQTAGLIRKLHLSSTTDSLTGLHNHGTFLQKLAEHVQCARESGEEVSLIVLDMDDFKEINDIAGHWEGNRVLQALANALRRCSRDEDVIARCGGDEFAVILPNTGPRQAAVVAERTARVMRDAAVCSGLDCPITASWGIASYPRDASTDEALFRAADSRLYDAKEAGGNHLAFNPAIVGGERGASCVREIGETPTGELVLLHAL